MRTTEKTILNPSGIHARPAAVFVRTAAGFKSKINIENLDRDSALADAKSMISVMVVGVKTGHRIRISADGPDEDAAIEALAAAIDGGLGETLPD